MKGPSIQWWVGVIILVASVFSPVAGSLFGDPATIFLAGMTLAGMLACEYSMRGYRRRRRPPLCVAEGPARN
jgi:hypothetical protein